MAGRRGRPPRGLDLVDGRDGDPIAKLRLKLLLGTLTGEVTLSGAADLLGVSERAVVKQRARFLDDAIELLEPRARGRPQKTETQEAGRIRELEAEVERLEYELRVARAREELALILAETERGVKDGKSARGKKRKKRSKGS